MELCRGLGLNMKMESHVHLRFGATIHDIDRSSYPAMGWPAYARNGSARGRHGVLIEEAGDLLTV